MASLFSTGGNISHPKPANNDKFTMDEIGKFVGGEVEAIQLPDDRIFYINEEGTRLRLHENYLATFILHKQRPDHMNTQILGSAFMAKIVETDNVAIEQEDL